MTHLLFIEHQPGVSSVLRAALEQFPDLCIEHVRTPEHALTRLASPGFDAVISSAPHRKVEIAAEKSGIPYVTVRNRGNVLPLHLCAKITRDTIIVEDRDSTVEFTLHLRRDVRDQLQTIVCFLHRLVVGRVYLQRQELDSWLLRDVVDASKIAAAVISGTEFQWCSAHFTHMLGYTREEVRSLHLADLFPEKRIYIEFSHDIRNSRRESGSGQVDAVLVRKNGSVLDCSLRMMRIDPMHPMKGHLLLIRDLSERKKFDMQVKEIALQAKADAARYEEALLDADALVIRTGPDGTIVFSNTRVASLLGYSAGELAGKNILGSLVAPGSRFAREMLVLFAGCDGQESSTVHAVQNLTKSGDLVWVAWRTIALPDPGGSTVLFIGHNFTDQKSPEAPPVRTDPWKFQVLQGTDVSEATFDAVFHLCVEIAIEGREGRHIGTSFAIGDHKRVMACSRQCGINAFERQDKMMRCIRNPANREAIKGLAQMDGGFVVRGNGCLEASCRHFIIDIPDVRIPPGFGTRHASASGITSRTGAIAIVVSESGPISIFREGRIVKRFSF